MQSETHILFFLPNLGNVINSMLTLIAENCAIDPLSSQTQDY
jgi:hypothetical protein